MVEICTVLHHDPKMEHVKYLGTTMLNTLMLPTNVPEIMKTEKVVHNVYCSPIDRIKIQNGYGSRISSLGIEFNLFPIVVDYRHLVVGLHDQIQRAIVNDSKIIFSSPDFVWSNGLADAVMRVARGNCLVCPTIRIQASRHQYVMDFISMLHTNQEFSKLFIDVIPHKIVESAKEKKWDYESMVKIEGVQGWTFYHQEPPPIVYWPIEGEAAVEILGRKEAFLPAFDHVFTDTLFRAGKIVFSESNQEVFVGEFTEGSKYQSMMENKYNAECAIFFRNHGIRHGY